MCAAFHTVPLEDLPRYSSSSDNIPPPESNLDARFQIVPSLNEKVALYRGPAYTLEADALLIAANESFTERSGVTGEVWKLLGKDLQRECAKCDKVRTGEVAVTGSGRLPCKKIMHSVGPRYNEQYRTAAENALHFCYRNSLRLLKEEKLRTLAATCVYTKRKRYPRDAAAHIVIRTARRFLEKYGDDVDRIVFCFDDDEDKAIYEKIVPLYFPRDDKELQYSVENLPADVGNEDGETVIAERKIRINSFPIAPTLSKNLFEAKAAKNERGFETMDPLVDLAQQRFKVNGFSQMVPDQDEIRKQAVQRQLKNMSRGERSNLRYERMLRDSRAEDLSDVAKLGFIYKSGRDINGSTIIVIVARHLPAKKVDMNRVLLYIIRVMDSIVEKSYSIVYVHSQMQSQNQPELSWMQEVTSIFNRKYKKNLKKFFVVHPTFWVKMVFWSLSPVISGKFWSKLKYVSALSELEKYLEIEKLDLPEQVIAHDRKRSGSGVSAGAAFAARSGVGGGVTTGSTAAPAPQPSRISEVRKAL
ncbi:hypothetical protein TrCOL_g2869 [Triparma columacea]|uniref:Macro domain-containing protein n=1 Tax=Triparma columacea TaxID=722753 RepID=A0A9W7LBX9_9STRA|nr:hypothetical protein TrCOL_g2869 [Triparma columacea]